MIDPARRRLARWKLLAIALVFLAPMLLAAGLTLGGWQPGGRSHGQPIWPQRNLAEEALSVRLEDGRQYPWRDPQQPRLTLLALAGPHCLEQCLSTLTKLAAARVTLSRNAERLRLVYLGEPPDRGRSQGMRNYWLIGSEAGDRLAPYRPTQADSVSVLLVESNGTALSYYPAGFDPTGLRKDLQRVIH
jgi:hypothetical protein